MMTTYKPGATRPPVKHSERGLSLVEILISMVIGLVVIGAVLPAYLTSGTGQNSNAALSQISEDATLALNLIRKQVSLAGYSRPIALSNKGFNRAYEGRAIFGCDVPDFTDHGVATIGELTCSGTATTNNSAITVVYEADAENAMMQTNVTPNRPRDCVGAGIAQTPAAGTTPDYYLAESRLFVDGNTLRCQGNGQTSLPVAGTGLAATAQPLVDNVVSMRIRYGISTTANVTGIDGTVIQQPAATPNRFLTATAVGTTPAAANWRNVKAIRICIVVRSDQEVLDAPTGYYDCDAIEATNPTPTMPTDRRLYRAFSTTVMIKNRLQG
jgi:type IV pilus assembly protein PilW